MTDTTEKISFPGQINVLRAELLDHAGKYIDLTGVIGDITLYEDLFSNTMSGYLLIEDALDLVNNLPIVGQELLFLELQTPSLEYKIKKTFYIYKMQHRHTKKRMQVYMLNFCSIELIASINSKVTKAFSGSITDNVVAILQDDRYMGSTQEIYVDETSNPLSFIAPFWSPLETINWLTGKSLNEKNVPNFLFYETNQAFEFVSMDTLMAQKSTREYVFSDLDANSVFGATEDINEKYRIVESMNNPVTFDYLRNTAAGMHASTLYTVDHALKTMRIKTYDYIGDFKEANHLEQYPLHTENLMRKKLASIHFLGKNDYLQGISSTVEYKKFFLQRNSLLEQLTAFRFNIKVFGRTDIKIGDVVNFKTIQNRQVLKPEVDTKAQSDYYNGRYLISAIRHQIINGKHLLAMEIIKDSFLNQIVRTPLQT